MIASVATLDRSDLSCPLSYEVRTMCRLWSQDDLILHATTICDWPCLSQLSAMPIVCIVWQLAGRLHSGRFPASTSSTYWNVHFTWPKLIHFIEEKASSKDTNLRQASISWKLMEITNNQRMVSSLDLVQHILFTTRQDQPYIGLVGVERPRFLLILDPNRPNLHTWVLWSAPWWITPHWTDWWLPTLDRWPRRQWPSELPTLSRSKEYCDVLFSAHCKLWSQDDFILYVTTCDWSPSQPSATPKVCIESGWLH